MPSKTRPPPDSSGRNAMIVLVAGLLATLIAGAWLWNATDPAADREPAAHPTPTDDAQVAHRAAEAPADAPRRVRIPRPAHPKAPAAPAAPADAAPPPSDEAAAAGLTDRREHPPADADAVRELLMQQMKEVTEDLVPCVERWTAAEPDLNGEVLVRFAMDADGLQDVWLEDHDTVPEGMIDCFSDGVYDRDWAGITAEPLEVSWPVKVSAG